MTPNIQINWTEQNRTSILGRSAGSQEWKGITKMFMIASAAQLTTA